MKRIAFTSTMVALALTLSGCAVVAVTSAAITVVTLPVKVAYKATSAVAGAVVGSDEDEEDDD